MKIISWNVNGIKSTYGSGDLQELVKKKVRIFYVFKKSKQLKSLNLMDIHYIATHVLKGQMYMVQLFIQKLNLFL